MEHQAIQLGHKHTGPQNTFDVHTSRARCALVCSSSGLGDRALYVGFPQTTLDKVLGNQMFTRVDEKTVRVTLSRPIDENEFLVWRDAQEVEQTSRALLTPYSRVIESAPVYKTAYDVLTQVTLISKNIYLNDLDQFCKRELGFRHYGRYVDDFFLVDSSRERLEDAVALIADFLATRLHLTVNSRKTQIISCNCGVPFLGAIVCPNGRFLRSRTRRHLDNRWTEVLCTESNPYVLQSVRNSRESFLMHFNGND